MVRVLIAVCVLAAPLSADDTTPWRILLRLPKHPQFDPAFRANLERDLVATLQPGVGTLAAVEVIDDPDFTAKGWPALEAVRSLDGVKRHGLVIEMTDGAYTLTARQFDAFTGLATPVVRSRTVRTLEQIPRAAGLLLEPDFAPAGTVSIIPNDAAHVKVELRGHTLGKLDSHVKLGDVFAVSLIRDTATPLPFTLLKVVEGVKNGTCKCVILSRLANPFTRDYRSAKAIRALKLPTISGTVKLQLVDKRGKPHVRGRELTLSASDIDFTAAPTDSDRFEYREGYYYSKRPFAGVACVSVGLSGEPTQRFPVPVLNGDAVTIAFDIDRAAVARAEFLRECTELRSRISELSSSQIAMVSAMNQMLDVARNRDALARAETGRDSVATELKKLAEELDHLLKQPGANDTLAKDVLDAGSKSLTVIRNGQSQLEITITSLKELAAKPNDAKIEVEMRGQDLARRIKESLDRGDYPEAIDLYDKLIALYPNDAAHKDAREKLRAEWTPKDDAHRAARDSIRVLAAAKTPEDFRAAIDTLRKAIPVLAAKKDRLGLRKLSLTFPAALDAMKTIAAATDGVGLTADQVEAARKLDEILTDLQQCVVSVSEELKKLPR